MAAGDRHDLDDKLQAALAWIMVGSTEEASRLCGVPGRTIRYWMEQSWWENVVDEARKVKQKELDGLWTGLIHKAATEVKERLEEGDETLDKQGNIRRTKIKAKDLAVILSIVVDKRALLRGEPTARRETRSTQDTLNDVATALEKFDNKPQTIN